MKKIDQKLDQWIHNSIIRAEVRKIIEDYVFDEKTEAFKAGWIKCDQHQGITDTEYFNPSGNKLIQE